MQRFRQGNPDQVVRLWRSMPFSPRRLARGWMPPHPRPCVRREWYPKTCG